MDKKNQKNGPASAKSVPPKPARKKRRFLLWFFLLLMVGGLVAGGGLYYRLIPLGPEMEAKIEPFLQVTETYIAEMEPYLEKAKVWKSTEEETANGKPKTNFPLVDLDEKKGSAAALAESTPVASPTTAPASVTVLGPSAIASAASAKPAPGAAGTVATKPAVVPMNADTAKVYGKLSKLYGAMKAEEAVAVFNNLEDEQVILILSRMEEEAAAKVLSVTEPKRAARLTQAMIKRK